VVTWVDLFELTGDPFAQRALQDSGDFEYLFVKTEDVANYVDPLVEHFETSDSFLRVIEGERGTGKSTIMHYMIQQLQDKKAIAAYIPYQYSATTALRDPKYGVGADTLLQVALALGRKIISNPAYVSYSHDLRSAFGALGANRDTGIPERDSPPYAVVEGRLSEILEIIRKERIKALVAVDNYDRLPKDIAIEFWKSNLAQGPFSDKLMAAGVSVLFSARSGWIPRIGIDPDLSYLGEPIRITPLNDSSSKQLLIKRFDHKAKPGATFPFTDDAVLEITTRMNGVPRFILETARTLLIEAAKKPRQDRTLDRPIVNEMLETLGERQERYYAAIEDDPQASKGYGILHDLRGKIDAESFPKLLRALGGVFEGRPIEPEQLESLRVNGIVWLDTASPQGGQTITLTSNVDALLRRIKSEHLSIPKYLEWFAKADLPSTFFVQTQRDEVREEVLSLIRETAHSISNERIRDEVNIAATAYKALDASLHVADLDYNQIIQHLWICTYHLASADYLLHLALDEKRIPSKVAPDDLDRYLSGLDSYRELFIDFGILRHYHQSSEMGIVPESVQDPLQRFHRTAGALTEILVRRVESMARVGARIPELRIGTVEALSNQLKSQIYPDRYENRYIFVYRGDLTIDKFPATIVWSHKTSIYCISFVNRDLLNDLGILAYEATVNWPWLPTEVNNQISVNNFNRFGSGTRLYFGNIVEFANMISKLGGEGFLVVQIHKPDGTIVYGISRRMGVFELTKETHDSHFGAVFTPLFVTRALGWTSFEEAESKQHEPQQSENAPSRYPIEKKIRAGQKATADAIIEQWLTKFQGDVTGELMFVDKTTFTYLDMIPRGCGIRLIVGNVKDKDGCIEYAQKQAVGRPFLKIAQIEYPGGDQRFPRTIHERWLADSQIEIDFGVDLKDDAIGKSEHTIHISEKLQDAERTREFEFKMECAKIDLGRAYGVSTKRVVLFEYPETSTH
jgi:hypothetical protein